MWKFNLIEEKPDNISYHPEMAAELKSIDISIFNDEFIIREFKDLMKNLSVKYGIHCYITTMKARTLFSFENAIDYELIALPKEPSPIEKEKTPTPLYKRVLYMMDEQKKYFELRQN